MGDVHDRNARLNALDDLTKPSANGGKKYGNDPNNNKVHEEFRAAIVWKNAIGFALMHLMALYGLYLALFKLYYFTWAWGFFVGYLCQLGIGPGAHRLFTHRTYEATAPLRIFLLMCQTMAGQNCTYIWVRDHRQHHKYSDTNADPHNSTRGFFFSHIGWLMSMTLLQNCTYIWVRDHRQHHKYSDTNADPHNSTRGFFFSHIGWLMSMTLLQNCTYIWVRDHRQHHKYSDTNADPHNSTRGFFFSHIGWLMMRKHNDVIEYGKNIDLSDLDADPYIMFQKKYYKSLYTVFAFMIPTLVPWYFWNETMMNSICVSFMLRYVLVLNFTWLVNSAAHMYGMKPYDRHIAPVETAIVSYITGGEGWHNFHHCYPWDYRAGEFGGERFNISARFIELCERLGLASNLRHVSKSVVERKVMNSGDGSHAEFMTNSNSGDGSHAEFLTNSNSGDGSHEEFMTNSNSGDGSHAEFVTDDSNWCSASTVDSSKRG